MSITVPSERLQLAIASGVFDAECGAAFLNCPSVEVFHAKRREHRLKGQRFEREWRYSREQLEALRKMCFGIDGLQAKKKA